MEVPRLASVVILSFSTLTIFGCQTASPITVPSPKSIPKSATIPKFKAIVPDRDGDGVIDNQDICPNTPQHMVVDDKGCTIILNDFTNELELEMQIYFPSLTRRVPNIYHLEFLKIKEKLIEYPTAHILLFGHASSNEISKTHSNHTLSQDRALMVKYRLVMDYNIPVERITTYDCLNMLPLIETRGGIAYDEMYGTKDGRVTVKVSSEVKDLNIIKSSHLSSEYKTYSQSCELVNELDK